MFAHCVTASSLDLAVWIEPKLLRSDSNRLSIIGAKINPKQHQIRYTWGSIGILLRLCENSARLYMRNPT